jgi:hypothetical protein
MIEIPDNDLPFALALVANDNAVAVRLPSGRQVRMVGRVANWYEIAPELYDGGNMNPLAEMLIQRWQLDENQVPLFKVITNGGEVRVYTDRGNSKILGLLENIGDRKVSCHIDGGALPTMIRRQFEVKG